MGAPIIETGKATESPISKHIRPFVVIILNFTYVFSVYAQWVLPGLYEEILMAVNLASFGGRTLEKIKKNSV